MSRYYNLLLSLCLLLPIIVSVLEAAKLKAAPEMFTAADANTCFETYLQQSREASNKYAASYMQCYESGELSRRNYMQQVEPLRQQFLHQTEELCADFHHCDQLENDLEFFRCYESISAANTYTMLQIGLNASAAIVELDENYHEALKQVMFCRIETERVYLNDTIRSYGELMLCLSPD